MPLPFGWLVAMVVGNTVLLAVRQSWPIWQAGVTALGMPALGFGGAIGCGGALECAFKCVFSPVYGLKLDLLENTSSLGHALNHFFHDYRQGKMTGSK
jgi:hypothetical protein